MNESSVLTLLLDYMFDYLLVKEFSHSGTWKWIWVVRMRFTGSDPFLGTMIAKYDSKVWIRDM